MIFVTFDELRSHLDLDNLGEGAEIIQQAFNLLNNQERHHFLFTNSYEYKEKSYNYAVSQGWDPSTTLVLFDPPKTKEEKIAIGKQISPDLDWDDIQIGENNLQQIVCTFYQNCTLQKMANVINSFGKLKVFL